MIRPMDAIAPYRAAGICILPAPWQKKMPAVKWEKYQKTLPTEDEYQKWFGSVAMSGYWILCGAVSGMVGLDADDAQGIAWAEENVGRDLLERTTCVKTVRGFHWYFTIPAGAVVKSWAREGIELHGEGSGLVAPPSMHAKGIVYKFLRGLDVIQPLPAHLLNLPSKESDPLPGVGVGGGGLAALLAAPAAEGKRNNWLTRVAGFYAKQSEYRDGYMESVRLANLQLKPPLDDKEWRALAGSIWRAEQHKQPTGVPPLEDKTDTGNANRFIRVFGDRVRYSNLSNEWLVYDGVQWKSDTTLLVYDWVREALLTIYEDAALGTVDNMGKWGDASKAAAKRSAALLCARSDPRVAIHPEQLDCQGDWLNLPNGVLDLPEQQLLPHQPGHHITKCCAAKWDPEHAVKSKLWERVVLESCGGDPELVRYLQRAFGYALTASTVEETFFVLVGPTETGKSTITNAIRNTLGSYAADIRVDTFLKQSNAGANRGDLVRLAGVRMGVVAEATKGTKMDEGLLKTFVSGEPLTAAAKYQHEQTFIPTTKLYFHTNEVPHMNDTDDAIWRRAAIVPFSHHPEKVDENIKPTLCNPEKSGAAIMDWLVQGWLEWRRVGIGSCPAVEAATSALRAQMNPLDGWFDERLEFGAQYQATAAELKISYQDWADDADLPIRFKLSEQKRGERLRQNGCETRVMNDQGCNRRVWLGVRVRSGAVCGSGI